MAKYCKYCGTAVEENYKFCTKCGASLEDNPTPNINNQPVQTNQVPVNVTPSNGMAVAGFVTSLVSGLCFCGIFSWLSLIFSIIGVSKAKDCEGKGKGLAIAGIVISAISLILLIALITLAIQIDSSELYDM